MLIFLFSIFLLFLLKSDNQKFILVFYDLLKQWVANPIWFSILILFSVANWLLESKKWQILVGNQQPISFVNAIKQSLTSHSFSFVTPFKTGDYVFKTVYYPNEKSLNIIALNAMGNLIQLFVTTIMGIIGILIISILNPINFPKQIIFFGLIALLILSIAFPILLSLKRHRKIVEWKNMFNLISNNKLKKIIFLSFVRYLFFSHQFYLMTWLSNVNMSYIQVISLIFVIYFLSSYISFISLFDFVVKGSVAIWLFSFFMVNQQVIFSISVGMWGLNFLYPAIIGWIILMFFKRDWLQIIKITKH